MSSGKIIDGIDRQTWLNNCFPEWGTYLNEEIEDTVVEQGKLALWWIGACGKWIKTPGDANITIDFWVQRGTSSKRIPQKRDPDHGFIRQSGQRVDTVFANLRCSPIVIDPFAVKKMDAVLSTHFHGDHICQYVAAGAVKNTKAIFIGPDECCNEWARWGVPENRIHRIKLNETYKIKDAEVTAVESFDRTVLLGAHPEPKGDIRGKPELIPDMNKRAFNYVIKTPSGIVYDAGDSHFANLYLKHGRDHKIDIAFCSYGDPQIGLTDKMTAEDALRFAWSLNTKVLIPVHWDLWSTQIPDPHIIYDMHKSYKSKLKSEGYDFNLFILRPGGRYMWPDDKDLEWYTYPKGTEKLDPNRAVMFYPSYL